MRDQSEAHRLLASSFALLDRVEEARFHARKVLEVHPSFSLEHWCKVPPYVNQTYLGPFIEGLRKAGLR